MNSTVPVSVSQNATHVTKSQSLLRCVSYQASLLVPLPRQQRLRRAVSNHALGGSSGYVAISKYVMVVM